VRLAVIGMDFKAIKGTFFDRAPVMNATDRATRRVFSRFGAYVMRRARKSIKSKKGPSPKGQPPHSHVGTLKKGIFFGYEAEKQTVVIGPILSGSRSGAPEILEYGGRARVESRGEIVVVEVAARPYMHPAYAAEEPKLPSMWADSIKP
jgi:hypothetical protein